MIAKYLLTICLIVQGLTTIAQEVNELDARGGFKDIKLGIVIDSVKGAKLKKEFTEKGNVFSSASYEVENPDLMTIGDIKVYAIELETYKNFINIITVITEKDSRLMKAMENALGKATYNAKQNFYFWAGEDVLLTFESHSKRQLKLIYKSKHIPQMMKDDKAQKVENISNDF